MPRFAKTRNIISRRSSRLLAKLVQVVWRNHFLLRWHGNVSHDSMWYAETKRLLQRWSLFGQVRLIIQTQSLLGQWLRSCQWCFLLPSLLMQFMSMTWSPTFWSRSTQERSLRQPHFSIIWNNIFSWSRLRMPESCFSIIANFLITGHLLFAVVIIQNPIAQLVESWFNVEEFSIKRVLIRTTISFTCELQWYYLNLFICPDLHLTTP